MNDVSDALDVEIAQSDWTVHICETSTMKTRPTSENVVPFSVLNAMTFSMSPHFRQLEELSYANKILLKTMTGSMPLLFNPTVD